MTAIVSIEKYDSEEAAAKCDVSYVEMMAFSTTTLTMFGFPATVAREQELSRYTDWNNSPSNEQYFRPDYFVRGPSVETSFTPSERQIAETVSDTVAALTARLYGREMRPISTLLSQFGLFRAIMELQAQASHKLTVFEVGPGNGYLGAMLAAAGLNYIGFDNAQSLYLWQNRLLAECAGDAFHDWVGEGPSIQAGIRVQHLPWWHYLRLRRNCSINADIFVSNTNLGEMNHGGLKYTARIARVILHQSPLAAFLFTNIGDSKQNSMATVEDELAAAGFEKVCHDLLHAYVAPGASSAAALRQLDARIPLFNPDNAARRFRARDILKLNESNQPSDMDFLEFVGTFTVPDNSHFENTAYPSVPTNGKIALNPPSPAPRSPTTSERLCAIVGKTRQRGLGWLVRRLTQSYSRSRSG